MGAAAAGPSGNSHGAGRRTLIAPRLADSTGGARSWCDPSCRWPGLASRAWRWPPCVAARASGRRFARQPAIRFHAPTAGYFVTGFQVVFIGVHAELPADKACRPVTSFALALIGLFNVFGTLSPVRSARGWPSASCWRPSTSAGRSRSPCSDRSDLATDGVRVRERDGLSLAVHRAPHERHRGADFRRGHICRCWAHRVFSHQVGSFWASGSAAISTTHGSYDGLVHRDRAGRIRGADQPAVKRGAIVRPAPQPA